MAGRNKLDEETAEINDQSSDVKILQKGQSEVFSHQTKMAREVEEEAKKALEAAEKACKKQIRFTKELYQEELEKTPAVSQLMKKLEELKKERKDADFDEKEQLLSQKIRDLKEKICQLKEKKANLINEQDRLTQRHSENEAWLAKSTSKIENLKVFQQDTEEKVSQLSQMLPSAENSLINAEEKEKCHTLNLEENEKQLHEFSRSLEHLQRTFDRLHANTESIAKRKEEVAGCLEEFAAERQKALLLHKKAHNEMANIENSVGEEKDQLLQVSNDLAVNKLEVDRLQFDLAGKEASLDDTAAQINSSSEKLAEINERKKEITQQIAELQKETTELDETFSQTSATFSTFSQKAMTLSVDIDACKRCLSVAVNAKDKHQEQFNSLNDKLEQKKDALSRITEVSDRASQMLAFSSSIEEGLQRTLQDQNTETSSLEPVLAELRQKLDNQSASVERAMEHFESQRRDLQAASNEAAFNRRKRDDLLCTIKEIQEKKQKTIIDLEKITETKFAIFAENENIIARLNNSHGQLPSISDEISEAAKEMKAASIEFSALESKRTPAGHSICDQLQKTKAEIIEDWKKNPPPKLEEQLKHEIESILRAEAAAAFFLRQEKVVRAAAELSQVKVSDQPQIQLDGVAKAHLINQHNFQNNEEKICLDTLHLVGDLHILPARNSNEEKQIKQ